MKLGFHFLSFGRLHPRRVPVDSAVRRRTCSNYIEHVYSIVKSATQSTKKVLQRTLCRVFTFLTGPSSISLKILDQSRGIVPEVAEVAGLAPLA